MQRTMCSGDVAQFVGSRGGPGEHRQRALVDLEVTGVQAGVVGDDDLSELDVLVVDRLLGAIELGDDEVQAADDSRLQRFEILAEGVRRVRHRHRHYALWLSSCERRGSARSAARR
jgi:hypothetical protein